MLTLFDLFMALLWLGFAALVVFPLFQRHKKVKVAFQVDTDSAERARRRIKDLEDSVRFYIDWAKTVQRQREEIAESFERYSALAHWIQDDRDTAEAEVERLKAENKRLRQVWSETGTIARHRAGEIVKLKLEVDQLQVQLAGCLTAAEGATNPATTAKKGDFGWSVAYQKTLDLRIAYERLRGQPLTIEDLDLSWPNRKPE